MTENLITIAKEDLELRDPDKYYEVLYKVAESFKDHFRTITETIASHPETGRVAITIRNPVDSFPMFTFVKVLYVDNETGKKNYLYEVIISNKEDGRSVDDPCYGYDITECNIENYTDIVATATILYSLITELAPSDKYMVVEIEGYFVLVIDTESNIYEYGFTSYPEMKRLIKNDAYIEEK